MTTDVVNVRININIYIYNVKVPCVDMFQVRVKERTYEALQIRRLALSAVNLIHFVLAKTTSINIFKVTSSVARLKTV